MAKPRHTRAKRSRRGRARTSAPRIVPAARHAAKRARRGDEAAPHALTLAVTVPVEWREHPVTVFVRAAKAWGEPVHFRETTKLLRKLLPSGTGGRPKGSYSIDRNKAMIIAIAVDECGLGPSQVLEALGMPKDPDRYAWLRRRLVRGRALLLEEAGRLPDEWCDLRAMPPADGKAACLRVLRAWSQGAQ